MRVLVTGGGGFIGANVVRALVARGHDAGCVVRSGGDRSKVSGIENVELFEADILDTDRLASLCARFKPQAIFHLASTGWTAHVTPEEHWRVITGGTESLLRALRGVGPCRLICTGSAAEYGEGTSFTEDDEGRPETALGLAKRAAHAAVKRAVSELKIQSTWLRLFTPFGPWEAPTRLVPAATRAALRGSPFRLRSPDEARDFIAVDDVVDAMMKALEAQLPPSVVINICRGEAVNVRTFAERIFQLCGRTPAIETAGEPSLGPAFKTSSGSHALASSLLGWKAKISLDEGITRAISWWKERIVPCT